MPIFHLLLHSFLSTSLCPACEMLAFVNRGRKKDTLRPEQSSVLYNLSPVMQSSVKSVLEAKWYLT